MRERKKETDRETERDRDRDIKRDRETLTHIKERGAEWAGLAPRRR